VPTTSESPRPLSAGARPGSHRGWMRSPSLQMIWALAGAVALLVFMLLVIGGYVFEWKWTGLSGSVTLWDWLEVLALPVAIATAPLLVRHHRGLTRRHRLMLAVGLTVFAGLAFAGYLVPLQWTGFPGNTLWDWLELVLLPLVVAITSSLWGSSWRPARRHVVAAATGLAAFGVLVIAGYLVPIQWTGFTGNTMWDWVKLLIMPVVVPLVLAPLLAASMSERLQEHRDTQWERSARR
jgi:hypothetical protein